MKRYIINLIFLVFDFAFLLISYFGALWVRYLLENSGMPPLVMHKNEDLFLVAILILLILWYEKIYTYRFDFWEETKRIFKGLLLALVIILSFLTLTRINTFYSRSFIIIYFIIIAFFLPIFKRSIKKLLFKRLKLRKKVHIIGNADQCTMLQEELADNWYLGMETSTLNYEAIFIATKDISLESLNRTLTEYMQETKDIYLLPYIEKVNFAEANMMEYFNIRTSVIHIENELLKPRNIFIKEIFEKSVTFALIPFLFLMHIILRRFIRKDSTGATFFKQERLGKHSKFFICYKYRTMYEHSEERLEAYLQTHPEEKTYYETYHKYKNDPRITPLGKFLRRSSLDELPQILNVLKGDMSLVGPRPYMPEEIEKLGKDAQTILMVKPGITGLWQVSGRNELSFEKRKELDIWYIQNWSLWIDFIILLKTIKVVLGKKGVS